MPSFFQVPREQLPVRKHRGSTDLMFGPRPPAKTSPGTRAGLIAEPCACPRHHLRLTALRSLRPRGSSFATRPQQSESAQLLIAISQHQRQKRACTAGLPATSPDIAAVIILAWELRDNGAPSSPGLIKSVVGPCPDPSQILAQSKTNQAVGRPTRKYVIEPSASHWTQSCPFINRLRCKYGKL